MTAWGKHTSRALLVSLVASAVGGVLMAAPVSAATTGWVTETGEGAGALTDSLGVVVHTSYTNTTYADTTKVAQALKDLGVRHVRDDLFLNNAQEYAAMRQVTAQSGAHFDLIAGRPGTGTPQQYVATAAALGDVVEALEGPNEWDVNGGLTWASDLRTYQSGLYAAAKANPATAQLPVFAPALADRSHYSQLGDLKGSSDVANAHAYPNGLQPGTGLDDALATTEARTGTTRAMVTETGYHDAAIGYTGHQGVSKDVAGTYAPRLLLESALRGVERTYLYELVDESSTGNVVNQEASFGLMNSDWTPKPAYTALQNMLRLTGTTGSAGDLTYRLTSDSADVEHLLVGRADGSHVLFVWRAQNAGAAAVPVTLDLAQPASVQTYRPSTSSAPVASVDASSLTLNADAAVTAVVIPASTAPTATPTLNGLSGLKVSRAKTSVTLRWNAPADLDHVTLQVPGRDPIRLTAAARTAVVKGLKPGTAYRLTVRGYAGDRAAAPQTVRVKTKKR
jgi:hypothetical protein